MYSSLTLFLLYTFLCLPVCYHHLSDSQIAKNHASPFVPFVCLEHAMNIIACFRPKPQKKQPLWLINQSTHLIHSQYSVILLPRVVTYTSRIPTIPVNNTYNTQKTGRCENCIWPKQILTLKVMMECFVVDDPMTFFLFGLLCVPLIAFLNICTTKIIIMMKHRHGGRGRQFCQFLQGGDTNIPKSTSSIHVLYFLLHAAYFCFTWMTSCMHLKKIEC